MNRAFRLFIATLVAVLAIVTPALQASATSLADSADCFAPVPVQPTTWSGIKAMYSSPATAAAWNARLRTKSAPAFSVTFVASSDEHVDCVPENSFQHCVSCNHKTHGCYDADPQPRYWLMCGDMTEKGSQEEFDSLAVLVKPLRSIIRANPGTMKGSALRDSQRTVYSCWGLPLARPTATHIGLTTLRSAFDSSRVVQYVGSDNDGYFNWRGAASQHTRGNTSYLTSSITLRSAKQSAAASNQGTGPSRAVTESVPRRPCSVRSLHAFKRTRRASADLNDCPPLFIVTGGGGMEISPKGLAMSIHGHQCHGEASLIKMEVTQSSLHLRPSRWNRPPDLADRSFDRTLPRRGCLDRSQF